MTALAAPLYLARSLALTPAADGSVQIFPPGPQTVTLTRVGAEEPETHELTIDEATATAMETARAALQAKADAGEGDAPYFDFNHEDREASAWPKRIFWAGEDPLTGGVRAEVEWSASGQAAVAGKTFRRFSPAFHAADGKVTGAPVNMGGLVNRAAFTRIQPLFAKAPPEPSPKSASTAPTAPTDNTMNPEEIAALQAENATLKAKCTELQASLDEFKKSDAEATVAMAAKDGRIGTCPTLQAKWVASLLSHPAAKDLLLAMAPNPALMGKITAAGKPATTDAALEPAALLAKFNALPREEQPEFYRAHAAALKATRR